MKFCTKCGTQIEDDAIVCVGCGRMVENVVDNTPQKASGLATAAKVLMILGTIIMGLYTFGIALAWCIPMTVSYCKKIKNGVPISTGFKVCSLLFVSLIAGVLMLCDNEN